MYWLFAGDKYYPSGGMLDFYNSYASLEDAITAAKSLVTDEYKWAHIYDCLACSICLEISDVD